MIIREVEDMNSIMDQLNLTDILKTLHRTTAENTFFSSTQGTFSKIDHILGYKTNLNKLKSYKLCFQHYESRYLYWKISSSGAFIRRLPQLLLQSLPYLGKNRGTPDDRFLHLVLRFLAFPFGVLWDSGYMNLQEPFLFRAPSTERDDSHPYAN